ncbi:hypothetical protein K439DRAFT_1662206 [Ramaria rubella]|nr:hypothetical protein K439DRAFT_1662206 [Ramaria rubella]
MERYTISVIIPGTVLEPEQVTFEQPIPLLEVPVNCVSTYSTKPFKWLRYVTGVILGAEGFRDAIDERDRMCVTGQFDAMLCTAAHLIPHSKGNQYIQTVCNLRNLNGEPRIENICDVQNGLFLNMIMNRSFTLQYMSVLRSLTSEIEPPNFVMTVDEVNPPNLAQGTRSETVPNEIHAPQRTIDNWPENWPPRYLLDFHYGVICFNKFGIKEYIEPLINAVSHEYYPDGVETHNERMKKELDLARQKTGGKKAREREEAPDDMFDTVLKMSHWFRECRNCEEYEAEAAKLEEEHDRKMHDMSVDKVEQWMQSTASSP